MKPESRLAAMREARASRYAAAVKADAAAVAAFERRTSALLEPYRQAQAARDLARAA